MNKIKTCTKCKENLSINEFSKHRGTSDGLQYWCKSCKKQYKEDNKEIIVARTCIDCGVLLLGNRSLKCSNCIRLNSVKYYNNNKEKISEYWKTPKGKLKSKINKLKRKNKVIHDFTYDEWMELVKSTNGICPRCNDNVGIYNLTLDHIIPISSVPIGTIYTIDDVQPLCKSCNCSKNDKISVNEDELENIFKEKSYEEYIKEAREMLSEDEQRYI